MVVHECSQVDTIKEMQKGITDSEKRDILQGEQILNMQKDLTEIKKDLKAFILTADDKYATKERVDKLDTIINRVSWGFISGGIAIIISLIVYIWNIFVK